MQNTKALRIRYNNEWPSKLLFPAEQNLKKRLDLNNLQHAFYPAKIKNSADQDFHGLLSHLLEALDNLPFRPDSAFDAIWKALDAEFFRVKEEGPLSSNMSRFDAFQIKLTTDPKVSQAFMIFAPIIPMQTCEFVAKRIFNGRSSPDEHSEAFTKRARACLGEPLFTQFIGKYESEWAKEPQIVQRKAGSFLYQLMRGRELEITTAGTTTKHSLTENKRISFLLSVVMPQYRNERFHGNTLPPFRSSAAKIKTYAHAYFVFMLAYVFLLETFLYRDFGVIDIDGVNDSAKKNRELFLLIFGNVLDK